MNYPYYEVQFDDGEHIKSFQNLEEAREYKAHNQWRFISRYFKIFEHNQDSKGYPTCKRV